MEFLITSIMDPDDYIFCLLLFVKWKTFLGEICILHIGTYFQSDFVV